MAREAGFSAEKLEHNDNASVAIFTVHGRKRLNLVGLDPLKACVDGIRAAASDTTIRCAVLQGEHEDGFIGGADLGELRALATHDAAGFVGAIHEFCQAIRDFPVPVIARVRGHCLGAGLEIAAACDLRYCDEGAMFGMPEVRIGVPSVVEAALLPHLIGFGKTRELVYRGNIIDAREAERIGLVEQCASDVDAAIAEAVSDILEAAPNAIRLQKQLCREWEDASIDTAIESSLRSFAKAYETDEPQCYIQAFFDGKAERSKGS